MAPWPFGSSSDSDTKQHSSTSRNTPASPPDDRRPQQPQQPYQPQQDEDNPFIAFRHAVDSHIGQIAAALSTIPGMLSDLQARGGNDAYYRVSPLDDADVERHPYNEGALADTRMLLQQAQDRCIRDRLSYPRIASLYHDPEQPVQFIQIGGFPSPHGPAPFHLRWLSPSWFRHSPYAPAQLETHRHAHQHGSMWRAAFEDLLCETTGKKQQVNAHEAWTGERQDQTRYAAWAQDSRDWMLGLQCRGILPPQLPSLYQPLLRNMRSYKTIWSQVVLDKDMGQEPIDMYWAARIGAVQEVKHDLLELAAEVGNVDADEQPQSQQDNTPATEFDAYAKLLDQHSGAPPPRNPSALPHVERDKAPPVKQSPSLPSSAILSTLSTTERTVLPDGTVTTKVVLKRRFADGKEETSESVSTTHADAKEEPWAQREQGRESGLRDEQRDEGEGKRKGWFW